MLTTINRYTQKRMNKCALILLLPFILFTSCNDDTPPILIDNVDITSQSELEEFGNNRYAAVQGDVTLNSHNSDDPITDLSPLQSLIKVERRLSINGTDITNLTGLDNLEEVSGQLFIGRNELLASFEGLSKLNRVGGNFTLHGNVNLASTAAMTNLNTIGHVLSVSNHPLLQNLSGFARITELYALHIDDNASLQNLEGLNSLVEIDEGCSIESNPSLLNISALANLESVATIRLVSNTNLPSLNGLEGITTLEDLNLTWNAQLYELTGLNNLTRVSRKLEIVGNNSLTNLSGLNSLSETGIMRIWQNGKLENLAGLEASTTIQNLIIYENPILTSLTGLQNLSNASSISIINNETLSNFCDVLLLIQGDSFTGEFVTRNNPYNPTTEDMDAGNCSN